MSSKWQHIGRWVFPQIGFGALDSRSLAVFRIGLGVCVLLDLAQRVPDLVAHYSDYGLVTRQMIQNQSEALWSLYFINGSPVFAGLLFVLTMVAAISLTLGVKTRQAVFACFVLLVSLHMRNPYVTFGVDQLLRAMLLFACFLPLDRHFALRPSSPATQERSLGTIALLLQIVVLYFMSGYLKNGYEWIREGTAIQYTFMHDYYTGPIGRWLLSFPKLLFYSTFAVLGVEYGAALLLLIPRTRTLALMVLLGLQVSIALTMTIGIFPLVNIVLLLALIPSQWWNSGVPNAQPLNRSLAMMPAAVIISYVTLMNFLPTKYKEIPAWLTTPGTVLQINQTWNLFAPYPQKADGWLALRAKTLGGQDVDPYQRKFLTDASLPMERSGASVPKINSRWTAYYQNLVYKKDKNLRARYGSYMCQQWNTDMPDVKIKSVDVHFVLEQSGPFRIEKDPEPKHLFEWNCPIENKTPKVAGR